MGSNVVSGAATAVVAVTGNATYFGVMAKDIVGARPLTSFDKGISRVSWMLIRFILVMTPLVFLINGITKGNWIESLLFAVSVAVGLTPEMLPMIVTANLAKGAVAMARRKTIVKRLNAIQTSGHQTGLKNLLDIAVLEYAQQYELVGKREQLLAGRSSRGTWALRHGIERYNNKKSGNQRIKRKKLGAASIGTFPELPPGTITAQPADFSTWPPNS